MEARWRQSDPLERNSSGKPDGGSLIRWRGTVVEARWRQSDPLERNSSGADGGSLILLRGTVSGADGGSLSF